MTTSDPRQRGEADPPSEPSREQTEEAGSDALAALPSLMLLARMQQGEEKARDELVRRYWPRLQR